MMHQLFVVSTLLLWYVPAATAKNIRYSRRQQQSPEDSFLAPPMVTNFELINTETNEKVVDIMDHSTIDIADLGMDEPSFSINAVVDKDAGINGVRFDYNDVEDFRTERKAPYSLCGDSDGNFHKCGSALGLGKHRIVATPIDDDGVSGPSIEVNFELVDSGAISGFKLIYAPTGEEVLDLVNGAVVDPVAFGFPDASFNVVATTKTIVKSIVFAQNGRKENSAPFAYCGYNESVYNACRDLSPGTTVSITAIPFSERSGRGTQFPELTITFSIMELSEAPPPAESTSMMKVIEEGNGYQRMRMRMSDDEFSEMLRSEMLQPSEITSVRSESPTTMTEEIVVLKTMRGVRDANLPEWLMTDLLKEYGYTSFDDLTDEELDTQIDTQTISVDAADFISVDDDGRRLGLCSKKRKPRTKTESFNLNELLPVLDKEIDGTIEADLNGDFSLVGSLRVDVHYVEKSRCGITYGAEFSYAEITVDAVVDGGYSVTGEIAVPLSKFLFRKNFNLWSADWSWWISFFYFDFDIDFGLDLGVKFDAEVQGAFSSMYDATGYLGLTFFCNSADCARTRNDVTLIFSEPSQPELGYEASIRATITPYVDLNVKADLDLYKEIDLAKVKIGIVAQVPISLYGYVGNLCSDADGDGTNEAVNGLALDIFLEAYAYFQAELGDKDVQYSIDLNLFGWEKSRVGTLYLNQRSVPVQVYSKPLYFRDLQDGGSSQFEPVISAAEPLSTTDSIMLSSRSCHPFRDALSYVVDWGDNSGYVGPGGAIPHTWPAPGFYTVRARMLSDDGDREYMERWTTRQIEVKGSCWTRWLSQDAGASHFSRDGNTVYERLESVVQWTFTVTSSTDPNYLHIADSSRNIYIALGTSVENQVNLAYFWTGSSWTPWRNFQYVDANCP